MVIVAKFVYQIAATTSAYQDPLKLFHFSLAFVIATLAIASLTYLLFYLHVNSAALALSASYSALESLLGP